jgi:hypothetical protein
MVLMLTVTLLFRFRRVLTISVLILFSTAVYPPPVAHPVQFSFAVPRLIDAEPEARPQPPCGEDTLPPYPRLGDSAVVKSWNEPGSGRDWKPPRCTGWADPGFTTLVATAARFHYESGAQGLLRRIGSISQLSGIRYWSTSHKRWKTLVLEAWALTAMNGGRREDFRPEEMKEGSALYFEEVDNLAGKASYQMRIVQASADRLVIEVENASTMRFLHIPILHPGDMQSIYFLDRESDDVWRYYSIARTGRGASHLIAGNESSAVNRTVAFFRYFVGIPTDQEPPTAR